MIPRSHARPWGILLTWMSIWISLAAGCWARLTERQIDGLDSDDIRAIIDLPPAPWTSVDEGHLGQLLIPRASGSENITQVRNYIRGILDGLGWHVEEDVFTDSTPNGEIEFVNLVATFDIEAPTKLVLAAHYDSKWFDSFPENQFIGATDSAAPCATLLDVAESLTPLLVAKQDAIKADTYEGDEEWASTTLQLIFFDGEEAIKDWSATDSLYGSRHLASKWETTFLDLQHPYHTSFLSRRRYDPTPSVLSTIEHLVLLDLLGTKDPVIRSYYGETTWLQRHLANVDERVKGLGVQGLAAGQAWFNEARFHGVIDDDHRPFLERGVSILHLIPIPFPAGWHKLGDDPSSLDMPTLRKWNAVMRVFTAEYLGLPISAAAATSERHAESESVERVVRSAYDL